ncbi:MAG: ribose-5-phosphate isomerase RpiA [Candidatus Dormibacteria bacterium]
MTVGLGTGSTAHWFIEALGRRCRDEGLRVRAVPTSDASTAQARTLSIPVVELPASGVDRARDGADHVDPEFRRVKGAGGAMVRERIVAAAAARFVVVIDHGKLVPALSADVPLEILPFGGERTLQIAAELTGGAGWRLAGDGRIARSDNGNLIADARLAGGEDLEELAARLSDVPGLLGHGLFLGMADLVLAGGDDGSVTELLPTDVPERGRR